MQNIRPLRAAAMVLAMTIVAAPAIALAQAGPTTRHVKNVVLVHGAWADGSGWEGVYNILAKDGYNVTIVTHSNQSLDADVADTKRVLDRQDGPTILVGHSYGGTIITEAGANAKVVGLVYIAAFVPDIGESTLGEYPKGSPLPPVDISQDGMSFFRHDAYLAARATGSKAQSRVHGSEPGPFAIEKAGLAPVTVAAWKSKPSWYLLSKDDQLVPAALARMMATRAKAIVVEIAGSHTVFIANPAAAAKIIEQAAEAEVK